jgi:hypothetical protein
MKKIKFLNNIVFSIIFPFQELVDNKSENSYCETNVEMIFIFYFLFLFLFFGHFLFYINNIFLMLLKSSFLWDPITFDFF